MHDTLATLHADTYNSLADEYESRVETYRSVTAHSLLPFIAALEPGARVLDIGCAVGYVVEILRTHGLDAEGIDIAVQCIKKILTITKHNGVIFIGTTKSDVSSEGYEEKTDYDTQAKRFRKRWTKPELESLFIDYQLRVVNYEENTDEFGKVWMDFVVQKTQ